MEADIVAEGGISIKEKKFQWIINNIDTILKRQDLLDLQHYEFEIVDSNGVKSWLARMEYDYDDESEPNTIEEKIMHIYLQFTKEDGYATYVDAQISVTVKNSNGKTIYRSDPIEDFRYVPGEPIYWLIDELRRDSQDTSVNGALIVTFTLKVFAMKTVSFHGNQTILSTTEEGICDNRKQEIYRVIGKLENDKENSDVKIISRDGKEFYAYRWILYEASEVFKDMISQLVQLQSEDELEPDEIFEVQTALHGTTMKMLLHFIYTGKLDPQWSLPGNVTKLVRAVNRSNIEDLKKFLDAFLGKVCIPENAGKLLGLAEKASMKKAVSDILAFIRKEMKFKDPQKYFNVVKKMKSD